jgi:hypothetical protein
VTLGIPPLTMDAGLFSDFDQLKRFFYMYVFTQPGAEEIVAATGRRFGAASSVNRGGNRARIRRPCVAGRRIHLAAMS